MTCSGGFLDGAADQVAGWRFCANKGWPGEPRPRRFRDLSAHCSMVRNLSVMEGFERLGGGMEGE